MFRRRERTPEEKRGGLGKVGGYITGLPVQQMFLLGPNAGQLRSVFTDVDANGSAAPLQRFGPKDRLISCHT